MTAAAPKTLDLKTIWTISIAFHAGWALVLLCRPTLFESSTIYAAFTGVMRTPYWAAACGFIAVMLTLGLYRRAVMMVAHLLSALMLLLITVTFTAPNGINTATATYAALTGASLYAYYCDFATWWALRKLRQEKGGGHG